jgi:hypothetical protein
MRAEWTDGNSPFLVMYSDNFFDLLPGESKAITVEMFLPHQHSGKVLGTFIVGGTNVESRNIPVDITSE